MRYLLDTGVLLRLVNRAAAEHPEVRAAVRVLKAQGHVTVTSFQNLSEFWNVCTRAETARGGLGLTLDAADFRRYPDITPVSPQDVLAGPSR